MFSGVQIQTIGIFVKLRGHCGSSAAVFPMVVVHIVLGIFVFEMKSVNGYRQIEKSLGSERNS
jgi:hypothetical protein